jgi:hypothetical protein
MELIFSLYCLILIAVDHLFLVHTRLFNFVQTLKLPPLSGNLSVLSITCIDLNDELLLFTTGQ